MSLPASTTDKIRRLAQKFTQIILTSDAIKLEEFLQEILDPGFGAFEAVAMGDATMDASPKTVSIDGILPTDQIMVQIVSDDTGTPMGLVSAVAGTDEFDITASSGVNTGDGVVKYLVMRAL